MHVSEFLWVHKGPDRPLLTVSDTTPLSDASRRAGFKDLFLPSSSNLLNDIPSSQGGGEKDTTYFQKREHWIF